MNFILLLKPTKSTDISHLLKKPQTEDNQYIIDFNQGSTSRTKSSSACFSPMDSRFKTKNIDIKLFISAYLDIRPDVIQLYSKDSIGDLIELKDNDAFNSSMLNNFKETFASSPGMFGKYSSSRNKTKVMLYFSLSTVQHKVIIDFFNHNIDKMIFEVSSKCSVYLLKHMIGQKTPSPIPKENQILYSAGLLSTSPLVNPSNMSPPNKMYSIKPPTSHKLTNDSTVNQIIDYYNEKKLESSTNENDHCVLNLIFAEKNKDKYQIGLDFTFNIMKTSNKISFDESAPKYREVSDGLNLFSYCYNLSCVINKEMFTSPIGYGQFDIIKLCKLVYCPLCKDKSKYEVKNIGMINSQWKYKGFLNGQEASKCEGDGFTIDNQLYVLSEINIVKQFSSLLIEIKQYSTIAHSTVYSNDAKEKSNNDEACSLFEDLDAIDLYTPNEEKLEKMRNASKIKLNTPLSRRDIGHDKIIVDNDNNGIEAIDKEVCMNCTSGIDTIPACCIF